MGGGGASAVGVERLIVEGVVVEEEGVVYKEASRSVGVSLGVEGGEGGGGGDGGGGGGGGSMELVKVRRWR